MWRFAELLRKSKQSYVDVSACHAERQ